MTKTTLGGQIRSFVRPRKKANGHAVSDASTAPGGVRVGAKTAATASEARPAETSHDRTLDLPAPFPASVRAAKRCVDVAAATSGLICLSPVMVGIAAAIKLTSPGPVLYSQIRAGRMKDGAPTEFAIYKFRTMVPDAEQQTGPVWASRNDSRITPIGQLLRKTRLDELPQFFNVLRGDMSLVGPRPERPHFVEQLAEAIPGYRDRIAQLKPGITGWAQVSLPYDSDIDSVKRKLSYDLAYAAHLYDLRSYLAMELKVIAKTPWVVLTGQGAH